MFKSILLSLALLHCLVGRSDQAAVPNCDAARLDECTGRLLSMVKSDMPVPDTVEKVQAHCGEVKNATRCIRDYFRECASSGMKQMARSVYSGITRRFKKTCSAAGIEKILQNRECISASRSPLLLCYKQMVKDMYAVRQSSDKKAWHAMTCCFGSRSHDCALTAVKANCPQQGADYFARESSQIMDEMMETFCPANLVWGSKECANLISALPDAVLPTDRNVTILPIMMDILKEFSVPEDETI